jgi:hypothetical protein
VLDSTSQEEHFSISAQKGTFWNEDPQVEVVVEVAREEASFPPSLPAEDQTWQNFRTFVSISKVKR